MSDVFQCIRYIYRIVKNSNPSFKYKLSLAVVCVWSVTRLFNSRLKKNLTRKDFLCNKHIHTEFKNVCWCQSEWAGNGGKREEGGGLWGGKEDDGPGIPDRTGCPPQNPPRLWGYAGKVHNDNSSLSHTDHCSYKPSVCYFN